MKREHYNGTINLKRITRAKTNGKRTAKVLKWERQRKEKVRHEKEKKIGKRRNDERNNMPDLMISYIYKTSLVHDNTC